MSAIYYTAYDCVQASMPPLFVDIYRLVSWQRAFHNLAIGAAVAVGGYANGKFLEMNYPVIARQIGFTINKVPGDDITEFSTERAGTRLAFYPPRRSYCSVSR
jgi:hypothetical protein